MDGYALVAAWAAATWAVTVAASAAGAATDYLMDHSVFTYLMGPDGEYVAHFGHDATPEAMAAKLREVVAPAA